eukprot:765456-Hanusia_phi.AAC.1
MQLEVPLPVIIYPSIPAPPDSATWRKAAGTNFVTPTLYLKYPTPETCAVPLQSPFEVFYVITNI